MPLSWPYGVTGPVVGQMFHVKHWLWWRSCSGRLVCFVRPGCLMRPWAAARPRDRHTRACGSEWSISKPGQALPPPSVTRECTLALRHPPRWWRGCVVSGQALPPPSDTEVVAASLVFRVPSGPPARSPSAPRAYGSARRLEARPGPAAALSHPGMHPGPSAPSTLVARVCRERPGPNVADPRPRRRITVHTTACAKNVTD